MNDQRGFFRSLGEGRVTGRDDCPDGHLIVG
jgi:hypothetical protein